MLKVTDLRQEQEAWAKAHPSRAQEVNPASFTCFLCHANKREFCFMVEGHGTMCLECSIVIASVVNRIAAKAPPEPAKKDSNVPASVRGKVVRNEPPSTRSIQPTSAR